MTLTDVSRFGNLALDQEAIVTKPLKAQSLYNATKHSAESDTGASTKAPKKKLTMDSSYAKVRPLEFLLDNLVADLLT